MGFRRLIPAGLVLGVLAVCSIFLLGHRSKDAERESRAQQNVGIAEEEEEVRAELKTPSTVLSSEPAVATTSPQEGRVPIGEGKETKVVSTDGQPIPDAELRWTPVVPVLLESTWDWDELNAEALTGRTSAATTNASGSTTLTVPDLSAELGSVVWVDHVDHQPHLEILEPSARSLAGKTFELVESRSVAVFVVDGDGSPIAGASVEQHGVELSGDEDAPPYAAILFYQSRTTDATGLVRASRFRGRQALVASSGGYRSRPIVIDDSRDEVTLCLQETFSASGTVTLPTSPEVDGTIVPRITLQAGRDNVWHELGTAKSNPDGSWGPIVAPMVEAGVSYRALVHGVAVVSAATPFPAPTAGEHVTLHLDAEAGALQWFMAHDEKEGVPLLGATATVSWVQDGSMMSVSAKARSDGYILVMGIRPGPVEPFLSKPGYCTANMQGVILPEDPPRTHTMVLHKGVRITGRVLRDGWPVPDFEISCWPGDEIKMRHTLTIRDHPDGSFSFDSLTPGPWGFAAAAIGSPGSEPIQIEVGDSPRDEIVVELHHAAPGGGRVVYKADGSPATDAIVQPYVSNARGPLTPWGPPLQVGADGRFGGDAFHEGANYVVVRAPGYAERTAFAESTGAAADFGRIELEPTARLRVVIENAPPTEGQYRLSIESATPCSTVAFERVGRDLVATLDDVPIGAFLCELTHPNLDTTFRRTTFASGDNELRIRTGTSSIVATLPEPPEKPLELYFETTGPGGAWELYATDFDDGVARMSNLPAGDVQLFLRDGDVTIGSMPATLRPGQETAVELQVGKAELTVRVVSPDGEPISGVSLKLVSTVEGDGARREGVTNEDGEVVFRTLARKTWSLSAHHPALGLRPGTEVVIDNDDERELELVLDGKAAIELLLVDGDEPLAGLTCKLSDRFDYSALAPTLSNDEGIARFPRLTPGSYRVRVEDPAIWPVRLDLEAQPGAGLRTVEVRRLGDLKVRVVDANGVPIAGADVELVDEETGESVATWLADGRVARASGDALTSDKHGEIALERLPRGSYAWRVGENEGVVVVEPGGETLALLGG